MQTLSPPQIVELWERGARLHPIDCVLAMLSEAHAQPAVAAYADLPVGERSRAAVQLGCALFGTSWSGEACCPRCGERHEVDPPIASILNAPAAPSAPVELTLDDYQLQLRVPTSRDQASLTELAAHGSGVEALLLRCVSALTRAGVPIAVSELPAAIVDRLADAAAQLDPNAETLLDLTCVQCGQGFQLLFDAGEFLWSELAASAQRLLYQVHVLARAYGWSEAAILDMSERRRDSYLALVGA